MGSTLEEKQAIDKERLEIIMWFINLLDSRRASLENRAGITVSISSLLFGGLLFFLEKALDQIVFYPLGIQAILTVNIVIAFLSLSGAIISATFAISNVRKTSRQMFGSSMPERFFFYPRATFEAYPTYSSYQSAFKSLNSETMENNMLGELWVLSHEYHNRYQNLRRSIRLLALSMLPILIIAMILL